MVTVACKSIRDSLFLVCCVRIEVQPFWVREGLSLCLAEAKQAIGKVQTPCVQGMCCHTETSGDFLSWSNLF